MKAPHPPASRGSRQLRLFATIAALPLVSSSLAAAGESAVPATLPPAKPYTLYLGANLAVEWHGKLWPVRGVQHNSFVIEPEGKRVLVRDTNLKMKIDRALKLTTNFATIAALKAERAYSPANDPRHHAREAMMLASASVDASDLAAGSLNNMDSVAGREQQIIANWNVPDTPPPPPTYSPSDLANASGSFQRSLAAHGSEMNSVSDAISREQDELARKLFDAFRLSFDISSHRPLEDPYVVVMVRFRDKGGNPKTTRMLVYAQTLPAIGERRQTVRLFRVGFPRGYELDDYQIHLYDHGAEVATSAAPNEMAMTVGEAFQYSNVDYVMRNRDQTLPPAPAAAFWPEDLSARLPTGTLDRPLYLKVGKDGSVVGFFKDQGCTRPIRDADLEAVRPDLRFNPALDKGKPVEGVVEFNLGRHVD